MPGSGYPGTGPDGQVASYSHSWAFGTGAVRVLLGDVATNVTDSSTVTRTTNLVEIRAERPVLAAFSSCCLVAAHVNLCDQTCGGGS